MTERLSPPGFDEGFVPEYRRAVYRGERIGLLAKAVQKTGFTFAGPPSGSLI